MTCCNRALCGPKSCFQRITVDVANMLAKSHVHISECQISCRPTHFWQKKSQEPHSGSSHVLSTPFQHFNLQAPVPLFFQVVFLVEDPRGSLHRLEQRLCDAPWHLCLSLPPFPGGAEGAQRRQHQMQLAPTAACSSGWKNDGLQPNSGGLQPREK